MNTLQLDTVVAELHEELARAEDLAEACSIVVDRSARELGFERAVIIARSEAGIRGAAFGLPPAHEQRLINDLGSDDSVLELIQYGSKPVMQPAGRYPALGFDASIVEI